ncbi:MAG: glycosyltransferase [Candidatus Cloacimonetes bacterium]|nr:glycosyltransferase [Candidatus Cloacimonadota bacterium]MCF7812938.1 glycosyltransferase [Candidatus Cloacimonadota bacterium]MCF7867150.1 glycosyltransferase [Candidatus Cloacimonadota bacterium]MCF7882530.1 glycosyltransferase [Candidatus Cloacimonadota bacterium]
MIWQIVSGAAVFSLLIYLYYLFLFGKGLNQGKDLINYEKPFVSVVIAARNEEKNINRILTALVNQSYSKKLYEIIVANDASTDDTVKIVEEFGNKWEQVILLNVKNREEAKSPKKNALSQAIEIAEGEIVMLTDADCLVGNRWIEAMLANFDDADMVVGFSRTKLDNWKKSNIAQKFEHFDFLALFFAAAAAISAGKAFSCSGQNISYRKTAFKSVGGFEKIKHLISGDDVNLMQLFRKAGKKIRFAFSSPSYAYTQPVSSWKQLISQRSRWASNMKSQIGLNPEFFFYLISAFLVVILPIILLFNNFLLAVSIMIIRFLLEINFIKKGLKKFGEEKNKLSFYPLWFILQPVYFIVVACLGAFSIFNWKR